MQRLKLSTKLALAIGECRAAAYELIGRSVPEQAPDAEMDEVLAREEDQTARERIVSTRDSIGQYVHLLQQGPDSDPTSPNVPTVTVARNRERPSWIDLPMRERNA